MTAFKPRNPDWEAVTRATIDRQPIVHTMGMRLTAIEPGFVELRMTVDPRYAQQHGFVQAGIVSMLADNAGGFAALTLMPAGAEVLAVEFKINLMAPARGEEMIARARVVKSGRTLTVSSIDVVMVDGGREVDNALMQQTCMALLPA